MSRLNFHPETIEGRVANVISRNRAVEDSRDMLGLEYFRLDLSEGKYMGKSSAIVYVYEKIPLVEIAIGDEVAIDGYFIHKDYIPRKGTIPIMGRPRILINRTTGEEYTIYLDLDAEAEAKK